MKTSNVLIFSLAFSDGKLISLTGYTGQVINDVLPQDKRCHSDVPVCATGLILGSLLCLQSGIFKWDTNKQGLVLAAFFYGYTTTQVLGGLLAQKLGGKWVMLSAVFWTALLTLLTPVLTVYGDFPAIVIIRILEGAAEVRT